MAWGEVDGWEWVYLLWFAYVYQLVVLAVAVAANFLVRPLAKRSLLAERGAYLVLCYACTFHLPYHVKDLTGFASAGVFAHNAANYCAIVVFWRFMELALGTAPLQVRNGPAMFFVVFVALPGVEMSFTPSGKPEAPQQGWLLRRSLTCVKDMVCWMVAGTALGVLTQPSPLKSYAFAILLSSSLSCLGSLRPSTLIRWCLLRAL